MLFIVSKDYLISSFALPNLMAGIKTQQNMWNRCAKKVSVKVHKVFSFIV